MFILKLALIDFAGYALLQQRKAICAWRKAGVIVPYFF